MVFCMSIFVLFLLAIVLSVLGFMASDYSFGLFKAFLTQPSQEREKSCICVLEVSIFPRVYDFSIGFWNCSASVVFFIFHFIQTSEKFFSFDSSK